MTSIVGNVVDSLGEERSGIRVSFRPLGDTRIRFASFVPPLEVSVQSDASGDFAASLQGGQYEMRFDGRGAVTVSIPDDDETEYNVAELIIDATGLSQAVPVLGLNYLFSTDGYLYLRNFTTGLWHPWAVFGDVSPNMGLLAAASPVAATSVSVSGTNYQWSNDGNFRLKNLDTSNWHRVRTTGFLGMESFDTGSGTSATAASAIASRALNMRIVDRMMQLLNFDLGKWATPFVAGLEGGETLTIYPSVI